MNKPVYSIVVPVYNEREVITESHRRLKEVMDRAGGVYELIFVNDGSRDGTLEILRGICEADGNSKMLSFSRNFGHQTAITAGMDAAAGDAIVVIDADLQDPPEVILAMIDAWKSGFQVVYGKRTKRLGESAFKLLTAKIFYRILDGLTDVDIPVDTGDFRLIDRAVCDALKTLPEHNRYVRGLVSWVGFKQTAVEYVREERFAGETKYPLKKMLRLAGDGLAAFSYKPLGLSTLAGGITAFGSGVFLLVTLILNICGVWAWQASGLLYLAGFILLVGAVILICIGILGQYVARVLDEARARPKYIIGERMGFDD